MKILAVHQGTELYGSDRSFLQCVDALKSASNTVDVLIPSNGELLTEMKRRGWNAEASSLWIARRETLGVFLLRIILLPFFMVRASNRFFKYDLVYINTVVIIDYLLCSYIFRKKTIIHVREIPNGFLGRVLRFLLRNSGAGLVFNSEATRDAFNVSPSSTAIVIYNGVEADQNALSAPAEHSAKLRLLLIGRINDWKGQDIAIASLATMPAEDREKYQLRIVGSPFAGKEHLLANLQEQVRSEGLLDVVEFFPFTDDPSVHFAWADVVLVPSTKPEPFGRVAIEAMAVSKPVIAAAHGGLVEIVTPDTGILIEPGSPSALVDALQRLESSPSLLAALGTESRERYERLFTEKAMQAKLSKFVQDFMKSK